MTKRLPTDTPPSPPDQTSSDAGQVDLTKLEGTQPEQTENTQEQAAPTNPEARLPFEQHAAGLAAWELAAVKAGQNWPAGREVTLAEFQAALAAVHGEVIS